MGRELPEPTIYGSFIAWERPIQIIAADWLRSSDIVYDIGANTGGLAIAFARLVRGGGRVFAFECNPFMVAWAQRDIDANKISNISIVQNACYSTSNQILDFYCDDSYYSASSTLMAARTGERIKVKTKSIDDFCAELSPPPRFVKIDVEGAESHVIDGATKVISRYRPIIVIEYSGQPDNDRNPIRMLQRLGYRLFDVNTYKMVDDYYLSQRFATNVVAIPIEYSGGYYREKVDAYPSKLDANTWQVKLGVGRYVLENALAFDNAGTGSISVRNSNDNVLAFYHAAFEHLRHHACSSIVLEMDKADLVTIKTVSQGANANISISDVSVWKISRQF